MKKVIISFFILIILGVTVLILGWINVPDNTYGVVQTSFKGFDQKLLKPKSISWRWEKLIPSALSLYLFKLAPYKADCESPVKGSMYPSGNDYAKAAGQNIDFQFDVKFTIEFSIFPEKLVGLAAAGLRPETLGKWYEDTSVKLSERISQIVLKDPQIFYTQGYVEKFQSIFKDDALFDSVEVKNITPKYINVPDYELYTQLKQKYLQIEKLKLEADIEKLNLEKDRDLLAIRKEIDIIQNLEKYGETFKNYPILIEFLYLRSLKPDEFLKLSEVNFAGKGR
jgi:hypothetical protein